MSQAEPAGQPGQAQTNKGKRAPRTCRSGAAPGCQEGANPGATALAPPEGAQTGPPDAGDVVVGLAVAAAVAGLPETTLRRFVKRGRVAAEKGEDGAHRFRRADLEALRSNGSADAERDAASDRERSDPVGELAAQAFELFAAGKGPREAVVMLRQPPAVVVSLYTTWVAMDGGFVVYRANAEAISRWAGFAVVRVEDLVRLLAALFADRDELRRFSYPCTVCKGPVQATSGAEWKAIIEGGHLSTWGHGPCVDDKSR